jgi:transcriptional regulator with XRE-family HTH domain
MTQESFGEILGLSRSGVTEIESGRRNVNDRHLMMLERWPEYSVNVDWLRTGEGEMFKKSESDILEQLREAYHLDDARFSFITAFIHLPAEEQDIVLKFMRKVFEEQKAREEKDINEKVDAYRRQLEAEKREMEKSGALSDGQSKRA